jgi:hypothetical protein
VAAVGVSGGHSFAGVVLLGVGEAAGREAGRCRRLLLAARVGCPLPDGLRAAPAVAATTRQIIAVVVFASPERRTGSVGREFSDVESD